MIKSIAAVAMAATIALSAPASAQITLGSVTPGTAPYSGPTPTYNFDTTTPTYTGGIVDNTSPSGIRAQPYGSTGNYYAVGPSGNGLNPGVLDLSSFGDIYNLSFIWGSVDSYNTLSFLDGSMNVLASFTGNAIFDPANGNQTDPNTNPLVTFNLAGSSVGAFTYLRLESGSNAFEIDNIAINAVPEPATWAMMLLGFMGIGVAMRRRKTSVPSFA